MNLPPSGHDDALLEARLARLRPAAPRHAFLQRLHAAEPLRSKTPRRFLSPSFFLFFLCELCGLCARLFRSSSSRHFVSLLRPWPLAYASLAAAWLLIFAFQHQAASLLPAPTASPAFATVDLSIPADPLTPRAFLLAGNPSFSPDLWP